MPYTEQRQMMPEIIPSTGLQLLIFILIGFVFFIIENMIKSRRARKAGSKAMTTGELSKLVKGLDQTSNELDSILAEVVKFAKGRAEAATKLQAEINRLEKAEEEYLVRIEMLKNEPLRVVNDLLNELQPNQIRTPRRDLVLFLAGGVVSAIISIVLGFLGWGG